MWTVVILCALAAPSLGARLPLQTEATYGYSEYIVGGHVVDPPGKWPWQGSLMLFGLLHQCGCVLVGNRWVVTAAHCTQTPSFLMRVILGAHDIYTRFKGDFTTYGIEKKFRHADWSGKGSEGYPNDIAIIRLRRDAAVSSKYIGIVDMADENTDKFVGAECYITGWGVKRAGNLFLPNKLQEANTTAMTNVQCEARFTELIGPNLINAGHICVGGRGTESGCNGDSGGPLVCWSDDRWLLAGVTSWGMGNCSPDSPSVYTRISHFRQWIKDNSNGEL